MRILVLYTEIMGYSENMLSYLSLTYDADITVVCQDQNKNTPYFPNNQKKISYLGLSGFNRKSLVDLFYKTSPDLIFVSGWQNKNYLAVARIAKKAGIPVVSGMDNQWRGTLRQHLACCLSLFLIHRYFEYIHVAGRLQYEYAIKLGFRRKKILMNLYSADIKLFADQYRICQEAKSVKYPHRFVFVGRLHENKGIDVLLEAWVALGKQVKHDWELLIIGDGPLEGRFSAAERVIYKSFMQPEDLAGEIASAGVFVLPSRKEPWGVVIHEFAAAGLPLILSDACGAANEFLIDGYNGWLFQSENATSLGEVLKKVVSASDKSLERMGRQSSDLSHRITPAISAASLLIPVIGNK